MVEETRAIRTFCVEKPLMFRTFGADLCTSTLCVEIKKKDMKAVIRINGDLLTRRREAHVAFEMIQYRTYSATSISS